jgi:hypothetical protein
MRPFIHSIDRCGGACLQLASRTDRSIDCHGQPVGSSMCNQYQLEKRGTRACAGSSHWGPWNISGGHAWNGDEERLAGAMGAWWNVSPGHDAERFGEIFSSCLSLYFATPFLSPFIDKKS